VRVLIRLAAIAVLLIALFPVAFIQGFFRGVAPGPADAIPLRVALQYIVGPALLTGLGVVSALLLFGCRRSGRLGGVVFLATVSLWAIIASSPGELDRFLPLWFTLPPLAFLAVPGVGRACR
jgi:hypothetical protein